MRKAINASGVEIAKFRCVYITGYSNGLATVAVCDPNDANKMPCCGITKRRASDGALVILGETNDLIKFLDTSDYGENVELYVGEDGVPTDDASGFAYSQTVGVVYKQDEHVGKFLIGNVGGEAVQTTGSTEENVQKQIRQFDAMTIELAKVRALLEEAMEKQIKIEDAKPIET